MQKIAVLTSGGDAPGMNAAIRAVVRSGVAHGVEVYGVRGGYTGLIAGDCSPLGPRAVGGIIEHGGTILGTTRCEGMRSVVGQTSAIGRLQSQGIGGLVIIGGNGTQAGAAALSAAGCRVVGIASTIDNDLVGADTSIGCTTALDIALQAIDRLRVTASSHKRAFLLEVMGRNSGYLALLSGIAGGAEAIVVPEVETVPEQVAQEILATYERGKSHAIVVIAEGARYNATALAQYFHDHSQRLGFELRVTTLGHVQRGGIPGVFDRMIATQLGAAAVEHLLGGRFGVLLGIVRGAVAATPYAQIGERDKPFDHELYQLAHLLSR